MKFSKLVGKTEKIVEKHERGQGVKASQLAELQRLLSEKITRYELKLKADMDAEKRSKLEKRLRVVGAQLKKTLDLQARD